MCISRGQTSDCGSNIQMPETMEDITIKPLYYGATYDSQLALQCLANNIDIAFNEFSSYLGINNWCIKLAPIER